jgi:plasmid stabilization system protein ParE
MTVRILKKAQADLLEIRAWIEVENPQTAARTLDRILSAIEMLGRQPELGPLARDGRLAAKGIRHVTRDGFIASYKIVGRQVRVLRVLRGRRDWKRLL